MSQIVTPDHLKRFCLDARHGIETPTPWNRFLYASDGRIVVRIPTDKPSTFDKSMKRFEDVFYGFPRHFTPVDGSRVYDVEHRPCNGCGGTNHPREGFQGENGDCIKCDGIGRVLTSVTETIDGILISHTYSNMIHDLPGLAVRGGTFRKLPALYFTFDIGQGVLMGLEKNNGHLKD